MIASRVWVLAAGVACATEPVLPIDTGPDAPSCVLVEEVRLDLGCTAGTWSGWVWATAGCADEVVWHAWEPSGRHERHDLVRRLGPTDDPDLDAWALGPLAPAAGPADWSPGLATALGCPADELTWAVEVAGEGEVLWCEASGPSAVRVAELPGAPVGLEACDAGVR